MLKTCIVTALLALGLLLLAGCESLGACEGYSSILNKTYCYDDYTEEECDDYDSQEVNGANWNFYPGETCAERVN